MSTAKIGWSLHHETLERRCGMLLPSGDFIFYNHDAPFAATWKKDNHILFKEAFDPESNPEDVFVLDMYGHTWVYGPTVDIDYDGWVDLDRENYGCSHITGIQGGHILPKRVPNFRETLYSYKYEEPAKYYILKEQGTNHIFKWSSKKQKWHNTTKDTYYTWSKICDKYSVFDLYVKEPRVVQ